MRKKERNYTLEQKKALFADYFYCVCCKKLLPTEYEFDMCPLCIENELFKKVREYIRANDVTEYDVAKAFDLPIARVKSWIRQGRIQYKEDKNKKLIGHHCARCGELIAQGDFCVNCRHILARQKGTVALDLERFEDSRMRYLDQMDEEKKNI